MKMLVLVLIFCLFPAQQGNSAAYHWAMISNQKSEIASLKKQIETLKFENLVLKEKIETLKASCR